MPKQSHSHLLQAQKPLFILLSLVERPGSEIYLAPTRPQQKLKAYIVPCRK